MIRPLAGMVPYDLNLLIRLEEWQSGSQLDLIPWNQSCGLLLVHTLNYCPCVHVLTIQCETQQRRLVTFSDGLANRHCLSAEHFNCNSYTYLCVYMFSLFIIHTDYPYRVKVGGGGWSQSQQALGEGAVHHGQITSASHSGNWHKQTNKHSH